MLRGRVRLLNTWTVAHQAPVSMGFSRWEYCSGLLFPPPGDLPNPGIFESVSLASPALAGDTSPCHQGSTRLFLEDGNSKAKSKDKWTESKTQIPDSVASQETFTFMPLYQYEPQLIHPYHGGKNTGLPALKGLLSVDPVTFRKSTEGSCLCYCCHP